MKLAAWHLMVVSGALLLAAGSLRAQMPETLPEPNGKSSSIDPSTSSIFDNSSSPHLGDTTSKLMIEGGQIVPEHSDIEHTDGDGVFSDQRPYPASSGYWWRDGCWYGDFDFVIWNRSRANPKIISAEENGNGQITGRFLNSRGEAMPLEAGGRGTLGYFLGRDCQNRDHSLEVTYLGFNNWEGENSLAAEPNNTLQIIPLNIAVAGFTNATLATTNYRSDFQSIEIDYRVRNRPGRDQLTMGPDGFWSRHVQPGRTESLFFGLRGISEEEQFRWLSSAPVPSTTFSGDYQLNTKNHLLGFQVGGDCYDVHESFYWGIKGDAGIYCNFTNGFAHIVGLDTTATTPTENQSGTASEQTAAFLGELSFVVGYDINDHLMIHAGWDLVLLGGLALAPDQVSFDSSLLAPQPFVRNDGDIFYNGLSVGLEAYW
ncbi:MAG TPA: hypothetical protein VFE46_19540 [Pirellulales bacterium]|nr:hypothetical protein [Pirellulales bacterium]